MNSAVTNLVISLGMMQVSRKIPFEDENVLFYVRAGYILSNIIIVGVYLYTRMLILKKNDLTTLKYVQPPAALQGETESKLVTTTVKQYDLDQIQNAIKGMFSGVAMMAFMHLYMKYTNPLLIQSILPVKSALEQKIVQIHLFGKAPTGDLKRPFKAASMFGVGAGEAKTDKKSVEAAEKAGTGGLKED